MLSGKHTDLTRDRLGNFYDDGKTEVNLNSKLYKKTLDVTTIGVYSNPSKNEGRISFEDAVKGNYKSTKVGEIFGPSWATFWFNIHVQIPQDWKGEQVRFIWDSECEALLWSEDGTPITAFLGSGGDDRREDHIVTFSAQGGEKLHFYVEMACNAMFGNGGWEGLGPSPTDPNRHFRLKKVQIGVYDPMAYDLLVDFKIIADMARQLPSDSQKANQALFTANHIMNVFDLEDRETWPKCLDISKKFLSHTPGSSEHIVSAVGHCHIDTAWLWPYAETRRKSARSWASQLRFCDQYPRYRFVCSQAQQYEWVKEDYPKLYTQIKAKAKAGNFVPVGGTWVEMDCNIPSGESLVRQFLVGQRFFAQEFGHQCKEFWLPDTFGYAAQLPQIIKGSEIDYFLTQKLSWSQFNKFPHHTFHWEGLDGTQVLTHFPPTDTYNAQANVRDLLFHVKNYKDKERSNESLMVFGHGDGGGGPVRGMLDNLERIQRVEGLPIVEYRTPSEFFDRLAEKTKDIPVWVGELYFEYHRGTYTTQANTKKFNRKCEYLLREIEFYGSLATAVHSHPYPAADLLRLWKLVLLNQFHDVIPGTSINAVFKDAEKYYHQVMNEGQDLLVGVLHPFTNGKESLGVFNSLSWDRRELVELPSPIPSSTSQISHKGTALSVTSAPSMGFAPFKAEDVKEKVTVEEKAGHLVLNNEWVQVTITAQGTISSIIDRRANNREVIASKSVGNQFVIYEDIPMNWDAWDVDVYHLEKRKVVDGPTQVKVVERGPLRVCVEVKKKISAKSHMTVLISLSAISPRLDFECDVEWHESHKFLKVEFPVQIRSSSATYEIQYGHLDRPTHWNTSWDVAKFEVCGHKWADLSESGYGVTLMNDCKYGYATHGNVMRLSLLRSSKNPDPVADMGRHIMRYALLPHLGTFQEASCIREAYQFNVPLLVRKAEGIVSTSFFKMDNPAIIIETVKKAEESNDLIVRLYESHGSHCEGTLTSSLPVSKAEKVNLLEHSVGPLEWKDGVKLSLTPFQILTVRISSKAGSSVCRQS